jgi:hypothetical protein
LSVEVVQSNAGPLGLQNEAVAARRLWESREFLLLRWTGSPEFGAIAGQISVAQASRL